MTLTTEFSAPAHTPLRAPLLWLALAGWFALILTLATTGVFAERAGILPVWLLPAVAVPPLAFLAAFRTSPPLRAWVAALDPALVTATQAWRVVGMAFVILWLMGELPAAFAIPAGFGDVAVGIVAVFVTLRVARRAPGWRSASRALILAGMADFVLAFATGILSNPGGPLAPVGAADADLILAFPLVMIPAFAVPLFIILHAIAWLKLRENDRR